MKTTKRVFSVALALVLALVLFVPALAEENDTPPEIDRRPIITREPVFPAIVRVGQPFVMEIAAELPEGDDGELSFAWYYQVFPIAGANGPRVELVASERHRAMEDGRMFRVVVTNTYIDSDGVVQTASVERRGFISVHASTWWAEAFLTITDWVGFGLATLLWFGWMIPLLPFALLFSLVAGLFR